MKIFIGLVIVSITWMVLSSIGHMPGEHRVSRGVLVMENKCIMISWQSSKEEAIEAIDYWQSKK